ncbi:MAG TPA: hypothetical protein DD381_13655 [Lentisphaeria bacterium]|nr:MAG: hypothetical protein A2X47_03820 [Lentisphaerae bacterium GWF2_38_69]HBM17367.1 hypothetical protein [Lentisphaeria bacterium]
MRLCFNLLLFILLISISGCQLANDSDPDEYAYDTFGMDLPKGKQLYLAHCIWYTDPLDISPLNYHKGTIIPFGTPIDIVKAGDGYITFQLKGTIRQFKIENDYPLTMLRDRPFFQQIFTPDNPENNLKDIDPETLADMKNGIVKVNMSREEILTVFGPPPKFMNPLSDITWSYYVDPTLKTVHVVFKNDKVSYIFET